jgi:large subunit ribosomal protein L20
MAKVKWAVASRRRRKRLLRQAKGYRAGRHAHVRRARETLLRAKAYRTRDRKTRKREFRRLWVTRLSAAARERGLTYSRLMSAVRRAQVRLNRQQLTELALHDRPAFDQLITAATSAP